MAHALNHIAFIPDGNRRYAKEHGITDLKAHTLGYERFKQVVEWCKELGIGEVSFWGFSTENWKRSKEEVGYLMDLFVKMLAKDLGRLVKDGTCVRIIGRREDLPASVQKAIAEAEEQTKGCGERFVNVFFNYGGRPELLNAVKDIVASGVSADEVTDDLLASHLWSSEISDPDLIVRTSGEQRLSGFLPWRSGYSELYFALEYWPAFDRAALERAIDWYGSRERRFGGNSQSS